MLLTRWKQHGTQPTGNTLDALVRALVAVGESEEWLRAGVRTPVTLRDCVRALLRDGYAAARVMGIVARLLTWPSR